ncbi:protein FAR1-RELATED SEQUENCE 5-like [Lolium perenne]|uniref:protein FAR1-RELATED SEQUENCE 5-like n=1 Tax=Lolium perenne TaxID=4522 RepID=UPI003A9A3014
MTFDTLEDAHRHYLSFSYKRGFGIRYNYMKKSEVTGEIIRATMVCHKAGHQAKEKEDTQKPKPVVAERNKSTNARTECPARMLVKLRDKEWVVTEFNDEQNHPIFKKWSLTSFLRSHRHIPEEDKDFIKVLHTVNMETSRMMQVMAQLYEAVEGVPYTPKDMANFRSTLRAQNKFTDMQDTMEYFEQMKLQDKDFYYRWHIVEKATEEIGPFVAKIKGLREEMNDCINCSLRPEDFEMKCNLMVYKHRLRDHEKITALYNKRSYWVPAYFMHNFYPFLQTTQRSEGFNAVLKKYVTPTNSIIEFVRQYADIQSKMIKAQNKEESDSALLTARNWSWNPLETQMAQLYTKNIHTRFQAKLQSSMCYNIKEIAQYTYQVYCITKFVPNYYNRSYEVYADPENGEYRCACCKFERDGILCCHILKAMLQLGVCEIPVRYILRRWTWSAEEDLVVEKPGERAVMPEESRKKMWLHVNCNEFKGIAIGANETEDGRKLVRMHMKALKKDLAALKRETAKRAKRVNHNPTEAIANQTEQESARDQVPLQQPKSGPKAHQKKQKQASASTSATIANETATPSAMPETSETQFPDIRDPRVSNTKGRKRKKAFQKPLDIGRKEIRRCDQTRSLLTKFDLQLSFSSLKSAVSH